MIRIVFLFIVLGLGLYAGTEYAGEQGYVLISVANKTIEMSVTTLVIFVVLALAALFIVEFIIKRLLRASSDTWNWFSIRKLKRSRRLTNEGILKLMEGDWKQAEQKVTRWAKHHDTPVLCYLVAAQAALEQGDNNKRDKYLALAAEQNDAHLAVELTRAKQYVQSEDYVLAEQSLSGVAHSYPQNPILLSLLKVIYVKLGKWEALLGLIEDLKKTKSASEYELQNLTDQAYCGLLSEMSEQRGTEGLIDRWNELPKAARASSVIRGHLVRLLLARNADDEAYRLIKEHIKKHPNSELYGLLPELNLASDKSTIHLLENSLRKDANNAEAHSALGRIYLEQKNWAQAQEEFELALAVRPSVNDYGYLSTALEKQNKHADAHNVSKKAIALITDQ
ncbi:tetratricopeptide repeat protein [Vibrio sp.]|uniref:Tetratricopeptide repeat protein n=1 Tax=Vibrio viridaestus TaxID=2487322 RepID=A0A3N9TBE0_9VIBR|nr:heme biosynthesis HemY N-terminal domain-containing protein [Vibrio viridaestus]MDC0611204.1 tetratricopeptide repeat protein [Vibrio sp.]RQW61467.1 tetratricopeptide repeat protein [Vibrio viridaestus]